MARWRVTISGKGIRKDTVEKMAKVFADKYGEGASIRVEDATPPESRADRYSEAQSQISDAKGEFESLRDELQDRLDNMPENLKSGSKADEIQSAIDELETAIQHAEEAEGVDVSLPGMY